MSIKRSLLLFSILAMIQCSLPAQTNHNQTTAARSLPSKTIWEGKIGTLRLILRISEDSITKEKTALFDSPDQNANGIAVSILKISNDSLVAFSKAIGQGFTGAFNADKSKAEGQWSYNGTHAPMTLTRVSNVTAPKRPQTPKAPFSYVQQDGIYSNKDKSLQYGYTLTIPDLKKNYPAVIMITGSGQLDRGETAFGHKIFWVIADHLSRNGIAVLRIDDRGIGKSTGNFGASTSADFAQDVLVAVDFLKNQTGIDSRKIGLVGHSEGGVIGPMAITQSKDIAFMVSMAGLGVRGSEIMFSQSQAAYKKLGLSAGELLRIDTLNRMMLDLSGQYKERSALNTAFKQQMTEWLSRQPEEFLLKTGLKGPNADIIISAKMSAMFSPWMRYLLAYDPAQYLGKVTIPVLALNGEKDQQVFAKENLAGFDKYLSQAGNKHYKTITFPGLNHFFQHAATGEVNEYAAIEETISPEVLDTITNWIKLQ